ncbi:magnesium-dependent phosphatase-1 [Thermococcus sp. LS1]|uniref:magnesium-dependent phosphatase-1 n=1 Tax=Thermococcus sp. LS1 TaxID=1638259 RepID=UPI00143BAD98|nr:magnesium-dependent phosphatase-1 [Thermococcus sp. LS1]
MKLLVLDLDGTLWDHEDASLLMLPYEFYDDYLVDAYGEELHLFPGVREFIEWASERFILSIASWNLEEKVRPILEGFGLWNYFLFPKIEGHPDKANMILTTLWQLKSIGYEIEEVIYVDDRTLHLDKVLSKVPNVDFIHMWVDIKSFDELRKLLEV